MEIFHDLLNILTQMLLVREQEERTVWIHHTSGAFSMKSLLTLMSCSNMLDSESYNFTRNVWKRVLHHLKAQFLAWFILLGRLNPKKDRLIKLNVLDGSNDKCVLCNDHIEDISHLFFSCHFVWKTWCACIN